MSVGIGYDVHRFADDRALVLGGVEIPFERGLLGHSDADVLTHAIMDCLLGAAGLPDIGQHFPDTDPLYAGVSSLILLEKVAGLIASRQLKVHNIDATVIMERPKLAPHIPAMKRRLAHTLGIPYEKVNIKATTNEQLGFVGREEGVAALAVAQLDEDGKGGEWHPSADN